MHGRLGATGDPRRANSGKATPKKAECGLGAVSVWLIHPAAATRQCLGLVRGWALAREWASAVAIIREGGRGRSAGLPVEAMPLKRPNRTFGMSH